MRHNRDYMRIAKRLIRTLPEFEELRDAGPRIAYLSSEKEKKKNRCTVFGECFKVEEKYDWCCPYDFFIVLYEPNIVDFDAHQIETLIRHELHHVGIEYKDSGVDWYVRPHDVEDFWEIIRECGLEWSVTDATG